MECKVTEYRHRNIVPSIMTVSQPSCVMKTGTATITVKTYNNVKATIKITVKAAPKKVMLSASRTTLGLGKTISFKGTTDTGAFGSIAYTSSSLTVLQVNPDGTVTALAPGTATLGARSYNDKTAYLKFTVVSAPSDITLGKSDIINHPFLRYTQHGRFQSAGIFA